jgi:hypothetical protein
MQEKKLMPKPKHALAEKQFYLVCIDPGHEPEIAKFENGELWFVGNDTGANPTEVEVISRVKFCFASED